MSAERLGGAEIRIPFGASENVTVDGLVEGPNAVINVTGRFTPGRVSCLTLDGIVLEGAVIIRLHQGAMLELHAREPGKLLVQYDDTVDPADILVTGTQWYSQLRGNEQVLQGPVPS